MVVFLDSTTDICDDTKQLLYTRCTFNGTKCTNPIPQYFEPPICGGHCDTIEPTVHEEGGGLGDRRGEEGGGGGEGIEGEGGGGGSGTADEGPSLQGEVVKEKQGGTNAGSSMEGIIIDQGKECPTLNPDHVSLNCDEVVVDGALPWQQHCMVNDSSQTETPTKT